MSSYHCWTLFQMNHQKQSLHLKAVSWIYRNKTSEMMQCLVIKNIYVKICFAATARTLYKLHLKSTLRKKQGNHQIQKYLNKHTKLFTEKFLRKYRTPYKSDTLLEEIKKEVQNISTHINNKFVLSLCLIILSIIIINCLHSIHNKNKNKKA